MNKVYSLLGSEVIPDSVRGDNHELILRREGVHSDVRVAADVGLQVSVPNGSGESEYSTHTKAITRMPLNKSTQFLNAS